MRRLPLLTLWLGCTVALLATLGRAADVTAPGSIAPPDAAFVRAFNATPQGPLRAQLGDKSLGSLPPYSGSEYVFVKPGTKTIAIGAVTGSVGLAARRCYTAVLSARGIELLDHERQRERMKALVLLYNLLDGPTLTLRTADGATPVVAAVAPHGFGQREVNPVRLAFTLFDGERKLADVPAVNLRRGQDYSLFVAGSADRPIMTWVAG